MSSFFKIGSNMRERSSLNAHGNRVDILYSYETPVATITKVHGLGHVIHVTTAHHSATTTRHINRWLDAKPYTVGKRNDIEQSALDELHHYINAKEAQAAGVTA